MKVGFSVVFNPVRERRRKENVDKCWRCSWRVSLQQSARAIALWESVASTTSCNLPTIDMIHHLCLSIPLVDYFKSNFLPKPFPSYCHYFSMICLCWTISCDMRLVALTFNLSFTGGSSSEAKASMLNDFMWCVIPLTLCLAPGCYIS